MVEHATPSADHAVHYANTQLDESLLQRRSIGQKNGDSIESTMRCGLCMCDDVTRVILGRASKVDVVSIL